MQIIPVIDLMGGQVVHGIAGNRSAYRPVASSLAPSPDPRAVARGFAQLGARQCYVADLDSLAGGTVDWDSLAKIAAEGLGLLLDVGCSSPAAAPALRGEAAARAITGRIEQWIVPLESVSDPRDLRSLFGQLSDWFDPRRLTFSVDLRNGIPWNASARWTAMRAEEVAALAADAGFSTLIVLDVAEVGMGRGTPTAALCRTIHGRFPELRIISGGGVRDLRDIDALAAAGCQGALVASALHQGTIGAAEFSRLSRTEQGERPVN